MSAVDRSECEVCGGESFGGRLCNRCEGDEWVDILRAVNRDPRLMSMLRSCDQCNRWTINPVICDDCFRYSELPPQPLPTMAMFSLLPEPRLLPVLPPPCRVCECHPPPPSPPQPPLEPEIVDLTNEPETVAHEIIDLTDDATEIAEWSTSPINALRPRNVEVVFPRSARSLDLVSMDTSVHFPLTPTNY